MSRTATRSRARRTSRAAGPAFVVPPKMSRADRRNIQTLIDAQVREARAKAGPKVPFRFRFQLAPLGWLAAIPAAWLAAKTGAQLFLACCAIVTVGAAVAGSRHRRAFTAAVVQFSATWAGLWAIIWAHAGNGWWSAIWLLGYAIPYWRWLHEYRWRPATPGVPADTSVSDTWRALAGQQKWEAWIGAGQRIPGGMRYPVTCKGTHTHIDQITVKPDAVAAAFAASPTEVYVEPHRHGRKDLGWLTIIAAGALDTPRPWAGGSIGPDGIGTVGRFPDGAPLRQRWFVPGVGGGIRHTIVAGCDGSGKTGFLDLTLAISAASGLVASVILDPQEGQALPAWQDKLPYARGTDECMTWLRGLHAAMFARSAYLGQLRWTDRKGRTRKGMGFFDTHMTGLPIIEIVIDEAPILLAVPGAVELVTQIAKLGRKTGFRLVLAAQVPSIAELGKQELRSMLAGGNVYCFRTGDKVTKGMVNIPADPEKLPKFFPDDSPTVGLGYADTIDARQWARMRADWLEDPYEAADNASPRALDDAVAERLARAVAVDADNVASLAQAADADAKAKLLILQALATPKDMGALIAALMDDGLAVSKVVSGVKDLEADGKVRRHKGRLEVVSP